MPSIRLLLIVTTALLIAVAQTPHASADADAVDHRAKLSASSFDGNGTVGAPVIEQDSDFEVFSESVNAFDDLTQGRSAEADAVQETTVDFADPVTSTVDTSGAAQALWSDSQPGDGKAPTASATSEFEITFIVTSDNTSFSLVGEIGLGADPANSACSTVTVESPDGTNFEVAAPAACGSSSLDIDESGELAAGTHTFSVIAIALASNPNATGGGVEAAFNLSLTLGCGTGASPASTDDDTDGDNIPDNIENNITHTDPGCQDTDGDGLLDPWEVAEDVEGAGFDLDGDGDAEVKRDAVFGPYAGQCLDLTGPRFERLGQHCGLVNPPDPLHKDVYVEMDWQDCWEGNCPELIPAPGFRPDPSHHAPDMAGLLDVVNMFGNAPVENPDETNGVNLHILVDEPIKHIHNCDQAPAATRGTNFGTEDQRDDPNKTHILDARAIAFRYSWSGHSSIEDYTPPPNESCPLPSLFTIGLAGAGLGPLPYYDTSPPGHALQGGRDVLVTLAVSWICQLYSFNAPSAIGNFPPCFRKFIGIATVIVPGLFPADIALPNGGSEEVPLPMHMLLGIPPADAVEQLWGRTFAHYLGTALGVPPGSLGNNPRTTGAQPVNSYGNWEGVSYAPPSGLPVQSLTPAGGAAPELILPDYTLADHDQDGDGTIEKDDNCPALSNVGQSDIDGDDVGDACDEDPDDDGLVGSADAQPNDTDNDGTPNTTDGDDDDDSLSDIDDNCPVAGNAGQENADADAFGDACDTDRDGDGLPNSFEALVGTDPDDPAGTPEFVGNGESCTDAQDNDGDGSTDAADDGCQDPDADTVPTSIDNCPALATNNLQDTDSDGTGDACETPGEPRLWGDNDCDGGLSSRDNQALSRKVLQQAALSQSEPCPDLGDTVTVTGAGDKAWGDLDCDGAITSRDGQALLRKVLQQAALSQTQPCVPIGDPAAVSEPAALMASRAVARAATAGKSVY